MAISLSFSSRCLSRLARGVCVEMLVNKRVSITGKGHASQEACELKFIRMYYRGGWIWSRLARGV